MESFVRQRPYSDFIATEPPTEKLGWNEIRWAFGLVLGLVAMLLFVAHRSLFEVAVGLLSAGAVAIGAAFGLIDALRKTQKLPSRGDTT